MMVPKGTLGLMQDVTDRLRRIRDALTAGLVERDLAIRLALLAALAGEHLLLIGPPGTAKSLLARRLHLAFADGVYFERLLTQFSVPEELFGPLSIKGLEEDRYERLTESYLPKASIAFLDEIFKANSAILNALLTLLNEREFDNGAERVATPLMAVVGASNELPESAELDALFDRFLLRLHLEPVSKQEFANLLRLRDNIPPVLPNRAKLTRSDLEELQLATAKVDVPDDVLALMGDLREWCNAEDIFVSDRRWRKVVKLLQTSAVTHGRNAVSIWDCWLLQHCLWSESADRAKIGDWYALRVGAASVEPSRLVRVVNAWERQLDNDKTAQARNAEGKLLFEDGRGRPTTQSRGQAYREEEPLFVLNGASSGFGYEIDATNDGKGYTKREIDAMHNVTISGRRVRSVELVDNQEYWLMANLDPLMETRKYESVYIEHIMSGLGEIRNELASYKSGVERQITSFQDDIRSHIWVTGDFVDPASQGLEKALADAEALLERLTKVTKGFQALPRGEDISP